MANWVDHDLTVTGPAAALTRFLETCFAAETCFLEDDEIQQFAFNKLIPQPPEDLSEDLVPYVCGDGSTFQIPAWEAWRFKHWGTGRPAFCTEVERPESDAIRLHFKTTWSIPWPIYEELAKRFPQLTIEGEICEPLMCFGGHISCHAGEVRYIDKTAEIDAQMSLENEKAMDANDIAARGKAATAPTNANDPTDDDVMF